MSIDVEQILDRLHGALTKLERAVSLHDTELAALKAHVHDFRRSNANALKLIARQVTVTREHVDVVEQSVANLRADRTRRGAR